MVVQDEMDCPNMREFVTVDLVSWNNGVMESIHAQDKDGIT